MSEQATSPSPVHPFIESDRVEGTHVYSVDGDHIGTIKRLVIEKVSGQVAYAVTSLGRYFNRFCCKVRFLRVESKSGYKDSKGLPMPASSKN
jgi:hypothetical protein